MSKKLIAALGLTLALAACNTTADVTTDDETVPSDDAMIDDQGDAMVDESSSSSVEAASGAAIDEQVEVDGDVEVSE